MTKTETDRIAYAVQRSRRSTADIVVERDGSVIVRAPEWADDATIAGLVEAKHYWIYRALAEWRELNATRILREYKNGEGFLYLGRSYRLALVTDQDEALQFRNGRFHLRRDVIESGDATAAQKVFRDFYIARGRERIQGRVTYYLPKVGVTIRDLDVRDLGNRWATCSRSGRLAFHWKCLMAPQTIIDYIVVHELCHRHQIDHTDAFWNEIDKILPDYRERKAWLRKHGAGLDV